MLTRWQRITTGCHCPDCMSCDECGQWPCICNCCESCGEELLRDETEGVCSECAAKTEEVAA